jgi:hypothetical protein
MHNDLCQDTNECISGVSKCDVNSQVCTNLAGSYFCECRQGFVQSNNPYLCEGKYIIKKCLFNFC